MTLIKKIKEHSFLFFELVKRDFKEKYKRTLLGILWSLLSPLLTLLIMSLVFTHFFGNSTPHYTIYLFCGNILFSYFSEATGSGMSSLLANAHVFTKINVPKYLFLFSRNVSSFINFSLTFLVFLIFCIIDGISPGASFLLLIYPILLITVFNLGVGLILSALYVFFRDMQYLWSLFTLMLMYLSAIFYTVDIFPDGAERLFMLNPVYVYIKYFRVIVIDGNIPSTEHHLLCALYASVAFILGALIYKKFNHRFLYYV